MYDPLLKEIETATHKVCSVKVYRGGKIAESLHASYLRVWSMPVITRRANTLQVT